MRQSRNSRVAAWRAWNKRDAERWYLYRRGDTTREQWAAACRKDPAPPCPSDNDFKIVDGRMAEKEED